MKSTNLSQSQSVVLGTRMKKILGVFALVGLFVCGVAVGLVWHDGANENVRQIAMTENQCDKIADRIITETNAEKLRSLNEIFAANCAGRAVEDTSPSGGAVVTDVNDMTTCEKIENLLLTDLQPADSKDAWRHNENAGLYNRLAQHGCPEHTEMFKQLMAQEYAIANALGAPARNVAEDMRACEEIEAHLKQNLHEYASDSRDYLHNADVYGTLAQRGCAENAQKYKNLALRQMEIATALARGDEMAQPENAEIVIDTYKKLQMQAQAQDFLNKMKMLSDPAIDFILTMEKIINE